MIENLELSPEEIAKNTNLQDLPGEVWKDVVGYEGLYQVSNVGRVKTIDKEIVFKTRPANTKLTDELILEIKNLYLSGEYSQCILAKKFGIHQSRISKYDLGRLFNISHKVAWQVATHKIWKHIE